MTRIYLISFLAFLSAVILSLKFGASIDASTDVIFALRLPRVLLAAAVGISLSVAGATLQALFSNPLCEPYTLGISSGSALGAVIGVASGFELSAAGLTGSAFLGALAFTFILHLISLARGSGSFTLLLSGVMLGFLGSSFVALIMATHDAGSLQGVLYWLLGDLSRARMAGSQIALTLSLVLSIAIWTKWRALDALLLGEEAALSVGISVKRERRVLMLFCSLLVGLAVSAAGMIGFIGLVIPHFARRLVGSLHSRLLPICALWGAIVLISADLLARLIIRPYELPVGVVTALIGAPVFLWIMLRRRESLGDLK